MTVIHVHGSYSDHRIDGPAGNAARRAGGDGIVGPYSIMRIFMDGTGEEVRFNKPIRLAPFGKEVIAKEKPDMAEDKVDASAARLLSAFAIAMMVGRFITGVTTITDFGSWLIVGSAILAAIVIFVMMGVSKGSGAFVLAAVSGLVFARPHHARVSPP